MENNNLSLLSDLVYIVKADGKITQSELDFLMRIAKRMKISTEQVKDLFTNPLPTKTNFTEIEKITQFQKMVLLMNVDGETHPKEIEAIKNYGLAMGIRPTVIDHVLLKMEDYPDKIIPPQELIHLFQKYYN